MRSEPGHLRIKATDTRRMARACTAAIGLLGVIAWIVLAPKPARADVEIASFADHATERYARVEFGASPTSARLLFIDAEAGLSWSDDPVEITTQVNGSVLSLVLRAGLASTRRDVRRHNLDLQCRQHPHRSRPRNRGDHQRKPHVRDLIGYGGRDRIRTR